MEGGRARSVGDIPQKEPMLFIDAIREMSADRSSIVCSFTPGARPCAGLDPDGSLPAVCLVEVMAQAIACLLFRPEEPNLAGLILSVRRMKFYRGGNVPKGTVLRVSGRITYCDGDGVALTEAEVRDDRTGEKITGATLMLMKPTPEQLAELFGDAAARFGPDRGGETART